MKNKEKTQKLQIEQLKRLIRINNMEELEQDIIDLYKENGFVFTTAVIAEYLYILKSKSEKPSKKSLYTIEKYNF